MKALFRTFLLCLACLMAGCATQVYTDPWVIKWVGVAKNAEGKLNSINATCKLVSPIFDKAVRQKWESKFETGDITADHPCAEVTYMDSYGNTYVRDFTLAAGTPLIGTAMQVRATRSAGKNCTGKCEGDTITLNNNLTLPNCGGAACGTATP